MHGAGNDFVIFDAKMNENLNFSPEQIKKICDRHFGIGADGVIIFSDSNATDFEINYFEADGTTGNLCANGSRCVIKYAKEMNRITGAQARFIFNNNEYSGEVIDDQLVKFNLNSQIEIKTNFKIEAAGQLINSSYVHNGTPHTVIKIQDVLKNPDDQNSMYDDINSFPVFELAKEIRYSKDFAPAGTNVNFYSIENDKIFVRSYERGVEGETLACGTGIIATALVINKNEGINPPIKIVSSSGYELTVNFSVANHSINDLSLIGKAEFVFKGELLI